jgi:nucleotide-binding universal stress UspA family protein
VAAEQRPRRAPSEADAIPTGRRAVVGYDGSDTAGAALAYAAARVGRDGHLVIAHVVSPPSPFIEGPYYDRALEAARAHASDLLERIDAAELHGVAFETAVVEGPPTTSLVELAGRSAADEIVVGSRGFSAVRAALGSFSHALLHEADRPVVVFPRAAAEREQRFPRRAHNRVTVVGFDGSEHARRALAYAFEAGAGGDGRTIAVYAYQAPPEWIGAPYYGASVEDHRAHGRAVLDALDPDSKLTGLLERELVEAPAATALADVAEQHDADEIVVGARGVGRLQAALGSTSHALLHEAQRPVVVVPSPDLRAADERAAGRSPSERVLPPHTRAEPGPGES